MKTDLPSETGHKGGGTQEKEIESRRKKKALTKRNLEK